MSKFFVTRNLDYINLDAIQAITKVRIKDLYTDYSLNHVGTAVKNIIPKRDWSDIGGVLEDNTWHFYSERAKFTEKTIAYVIHTNVPNGGINNSHMKFYISVAEMNDLEKQLGIID